MRKKNFARPLGAVLAAVLLLAAAAPVRVDAASFTDVPSDSWCLSAVNYVSGKGLMGGVGAKTFAPGKTLTRAMFVTVLARLANVRIEYYADSGFTDVASGSWCAGAVAWARQYGIAGGYSDEIFGAGGAVTREQAAAMLARALDIFRLTLPQSGTAAAFADADAVSAYARGGVEQMRKTGILQGDAAGLFHPQQALTRAEAASIFMRLSQSISAAAAAADKSARTLSAAGAPCTVKERVLLRDFRSDIRFPEISGLSSAANQTAWNTIFRNNAAAEQKAVADDGTVIRSTFAVAQSDEKLLSVTESQYAYADGGMHGSAALFSWNFDMRTGRQLCLKDLCDTDAIAKALLSGKGWQIWTSEGKADTDGQITLDSVLEMSGCEKTQAALKALLDRFDSSDPSALSGYAYWENGKPCLSFCVSHAAGDYCVIKMADDYRLAA